MGFFGFGGGTTVSNMVGATSSTAGTAGLVPAPAAGEQLAVLSGDGTFKSPFVRPTVTNWGAGRLYTPWNGENNNVAATSNANIRAKFNPIFLPSGSISSLVFFASNAPATTSTGYLAVYNSDNTGKPLNIVTSGSFTHATTDSSTVKTVSISPSVSIKAGLYYLSYHNNISGTQTSTRVTQRSLSQHIYFIGANSSADEISNNVPYMTIASAGTWPDPATFDGFDGSSPAYFYIGM